MTQGVIRIEDLGKKYNIRHQAGGQGYVALRDVIADEARRLGSAVLRGARGTARLDRLPVSEEFWALRHVNFGVTQGEIVGIIGRNGAGKSTLLKVLSRITEPSEGRIDLKGRVASLLEVGTGFHPELTGRENVFLNGAVMGMTKVEIRRKFDEIVAFAEIEKFLDTPVKRYSSGMYVRLAFAVAAHLEPETLIIDEVLAVGDAEFQRKCLGKMRDVSQSGRTVLFVSHNLSAVCELCTRAILLSKGTVALDGTPGEASAGYLASFGGSEQRVGRRSTSNAEITTVAVEDNSGTPVAVANVGRPVIFRVRYFLGKPDRSHTLMVQLSTTDGHPVWTAQTQPGELAGAGAGDGEIRVRVERLALYPKTYFLGVGIMNYGVGPIVWDKSYAMVTVVAETEAELGHMDARLNMVVMDHEWSAPAVQAGDR